MNEFGPWQLLLVRGANHATLQRPQLITVHDTGNDGEPPGPPLTSDGGCPRPC